MKLNTLNDLLLEEVRDIFDAEKQLLKALPKMADAATAPPLKEAFEQHLVETQGQVKRLERAFEMLDHAARGKKCHAMNGLIEEGKERIEADIDSDVKDASLIAAAQKIEHYEIATYGCICAWASLLGLDELKSLLGESLEEEKRTDEMLSHLAEEIINVRSATA